MSQRLGTRVARKEDPALLSGRGRYADDLPVPAGTLHAHVDPLAASARRHREASTRPRHSAWMASGRSSPARTQKISDPFLVALKSPIHQWSLAVDRVRFVGEPVALVVAENRYLAEDAAELIAIEYAPIEAVIDPLGSVQARVADPARRSEDQRDFGPEFHYGDTKSAFEKADKVVKLTVNFHRLSFTPMECFVAVA